MLAPVSILLLPAEANAFQGLLPDLLSIMKPAGLSAMRDAWAESEVNLHEAPKI